ncbi:MAG: hypothetical protein J6D47_19820 [Peptostreptococcaceae bacterium]|nr:hypothetical protein [Peptostreptococcaceae bacterium]
MKCFEFSDYIIGVSSKSDILAALNAYFCLIGDAECVPEELDEEHGYSLAVKEGYTEDELQEIELDETGNTIALIRRFKES